MEFVLLWKEPEFVVFFLIKSIMIFDFNEAAD